MPAKQQEAPARRQGREGSRWLNVRPGGEEVAEWFKSVPLHDGMEHEHYIGGVTLIQQTEKSDEVIGWADDGAPKIAERRNLVFTPYVKVETRVAYFWRLMSVWDAVGVWQPVDVPGAEDLGLPAGFFRYSTSKPDGKTVNFVGANVQVAVYEKGTVKFETLREGPANAQVMRRVLEGVPLLVAPPAQKVVPVTFKVEVDPNALMKAATGAVGRALGMAGMLIVPGSGVATAEDMLELRDPAPGTGPEGAQLPSQDEPQAELTDEQLRERAAALVGELETADPDAHREFQEWARGRKLTLNEAQGPVLRGAIRKLEKALAAVAA